jgi:hypothetical protein
MKHATELYILEERRITKIELAMPNPTPMHKRYIQPIGPMDYLKTNSRMPSMISVKMIRRIAF